MARGRGKTGTGRLIGMALGLLWLILPPAAFPGTISPPDKALLAARDAFVAGNETLFARQAAKAAGHPLASYVDFWRLQLRLQDAEPAEVMDFLRRHADTPLAEQLRRDWLCALGKKGQWDVFLQQHPFLLKENAAVAAYALQARWLRDGQLAPEEIRPFWTAPAALPEGLVPLVDGLLATGRLTAQDLRERFRILVRANLLTEARQVAERLAPQGRWSADLVERALREPVRFLADGPDLETEAGRELALAAITRLLRDDPQAAADRWGGALGECFPLEDRQYLWGCIAERGARRLLPEAVGWFGRAGETPLSDEQLAWRTRIALRQENWPEVEAAIARMSPAGREDPAWLYWRGRSLLAGGSREEGRALLDWIAGEHHFYGRLAAEELGLALHIPPKAAPPTVAELAKVEALPGLRRALVLYRLGLRSEGMQEWNWATRSLDDRLLLAAAELARRQKIWDRAINTANRTVAAHDFTLRYPAPYYDVLSRHARQQNLEEPLVFALVRRESRFIEDARSRVGASGLMQLMPETARWVARQSGMKNFHPSQVNRPEVNAALGTFYLRHVLNKLGGDPVLAAAAYNAGPARAVRWQDTKPLEGAVYIESIPFPETRQYVKKVMTNALYYSALDGGQGPSLKSRLGTVAGGVAAGEKGQEQP
jgi:soluble lytic murein transglycosylase